MAKKTKFILIGTGVAALSAVVFVLVWYQPQKLFIDDKVNEAGPTTSEAKSSETTGGTDVTTTTVAQDQVLASGSFVSLDHDTQGTAEILKLADNSRFVRFENFSTENGPDLYVYLSTTETNGSESTFDDQYVSLGRLKGNIGNQNYEIPSDVDLAAYRSVVVWCDRFNSAFGAAPLE